MAKSRTYNEVACHRHSQDNAIDTNNLKDRQPGIGFPIVCMLDGWYLYDDCDDSDHEVDEVPPALEEMSPVDDNSYDDLNEQDERDDDLGGIDEGATKFAHVGASHHLGNKAKGYHNHPHP